ncbi:Brp/Blh family beta-carotene 15,15'-monooxygenase [Nocardioides perillae]|uniref:Brp/Blh family beta-carotene 15,15'-monooxygenase n=1 Tax=Nocardioides perillae TaxID=1119534 RepID=A0A7Y9UM36_9ACTN|nr:Brp/Blh family beta-carotene 15,15'-monooxygenase [Nocardioides perillae]
MIEGRCDVALTTVTEPRAALLVGAVRRSREAVVVTAALSVLLVVAGVAPTGPVVLVAALLALVAGLPHGAVDHALAARLSGQPPLVAATVYAALAAGAWVLLTTPATAPAALAAVLALSLHHFAAGELEVLRATTRWRPGRGVAAAVGLAGTGALLLPLARSGSDLVGVADAVSPGLGGLLAEPLVRGALAVVWVAAAGVAVVAAARAEQRSVVADVAAVGLLGALAPPLLAFAVWFGAWHGLRHCARLVLAQDRTAALLDAGRPRQAVAALARQAAWPSLAATGVLVALVAATSTAADTSAALGSALVLLLALTVPHMLVVAWMDRTSDRTAAHGGGTPQEPGVEGAVVGSAGASPRRTAMRWTRWPSIAATSSTDPSTSTASPTAGMRWSWAIR